MEKSLKSGIPGVSWNRRDHKWQVILRQPDGRLKNFGMFRDIVAAAECAAPIRERIQRERAQTNQAA
ncbi:hypothetical protein [Aureimonas altamirensis]|uniref:hypothetical protein n=1 Tax=Aureimonas altamirensis TaxID=370622 RepID=UPI002553FB77|nr:hypothetical protein [Aureimonas altamirensis]